MNLYRHQICGRECEWSSGAISNFTIYRSECDDVYRTVVVPPLPMQILKQTFQFIVEGCLTLIRNGEQSHSNVRNPEIRENVKFIKSTRSPTKVNLTRWNCNVGVHRYFVVSQWMASIGICLTVGRESRDRCFSNASLRTTEWMELRKKLVLKLMFDRQLVCSAASIEVPHTLSEASRLAAVWFRTDRPEERIDCKREMQTRKRRISFLAVVFPRCVKSRLKSAE